MPFATLLKTALTENHLTLTETAQTQLIHYLECLSRWNRVFNLTAITDPREVVYLHIIDSLLVAPYLQGTTMLDVGSGAGLPGIPLAIAFPDTNWTLLDKNSKKEMFLIQIIAECGLNNVKVVHSRCEDFQSPGGFDTIVSRALGTIEQFIIMARHLLSKQGRIIAMKGHYPSEELTSSVIQSLWVAQISKLAITGLTRERHVVILEQKPEETNQP